MKGRPIQNFKTKEWTNKRKEIDKIHIGHSQNAQCVAYVVWKPKWRKENGAEAIFKIRARNVPKLMEAINA